MEKEKIYTIHQISSLTEDMLDNAGHQIYYAGTAKAYMEELIINNFTDLYEAGAYPYIILKTIDLNVVVATNEPLQIFEYQKSSETYKEIAYINFWISDENDEGIHYLDET